MSFARVVYLLFGFFLLSVPWLFDSAVSQQSSLRAATGSELASVRGMSFQEPTPEIREPQTWTGLCCKKQGGTRCTAVLPDNYWCGSGPGPLGQPCGVAVENRPCHRVTDGPSKHDACTTAGARPTSSCTMNYNGWCVKVNSGTCKTGGGGMAVCDCVTAGPTTYGQREYCDGAGSSLCP